MRDLRSIIDRERRAHQYARTACRDCAFNPATDDAPGWDSTAFNVMQAFFNARPFYCHFLRRPDEEHYRQRPRLCANFELVTGRQSDAHDRAAQLVLATRIRERA